MRRGIRCPQEDHAQDVLLIPTQHCPPCLMPSKTRLTTKPERGFYLHFSAMNTSEETQRTINPEEIPFSTPQELKQYTTDTGKILPRKYTHLSAKQQRHITKTVKRARNLLFAQ